MPAIRREFALALLLGAVGAGLVVLAARQAWAQAVFTPPRPLPAEDISVTGQQLVPLASALALAGLACLAAVIATGSWARRVAGALLAVLGAGAVVAVGAGVNASAVLATARADAASGAFGGSTTSGTSPAGAVHGIVITGSAGHAVMTGASWRAAAVCGAVLVVLAGLATIWRGPRWPVMSARFQRGPGPGPGGHEGAGSPPVSGGLRGVVPPGQQRQHDSAAMWDSLNRDVDPTVQHASAARNPEDSAARNPEDSAARNLEDQLGGGTPG